MKGTPASPPLELSPGERRTWRAIAIALSAFVVGMVVLASDLQPLEVSGVLVPATLALVWLAALGACIGSFLNVVAYRWPLGQSIVRPRSRCPSCSHEIRGRDNVPVFGWLALQGRCRDCRAPIAARYPIVELFTAFMFVLLATPYWSALGSWTYYAPFSAVYYPPVSVTLDLTSIGGYGINAILCCALLAAALIRRDQHQVPPMLWAIPPVTAVVVILAVNNVGAQLFIAVITSVLAFHTAGRLRADAEPQLPCGLAICGVWGIFPSVAIMVAGLIAALLAWRWVPFFARRGFGWLDAVLGTLLTFLVGWPLIMDIAQQADQAVVAPMAVTVAMPLIALILLAAFDWRRAERTRRASMGKLAEGLHSGHERPDSVGLLTTLAPGRPSPFTYPPDIPMPRLTFYGAAETVTGSKYLLEADGARVLIDCGLFQGLKELRLKNWDKLPFDEKSVDAVVLTHAHLDHVGYLPRLVRYGYKNPIYCTEPTSELAELILLDSARLQEEDAEYANRKQFSKHRPALPLYTTGDAASAVRMFKNVDRKTWFNPAGPIWCRYHEAGHLLGSSTVEVEIRVAGKTTRMLFSGDVGRYGVPLYHDPAPPTPCDVLICESTYGDRDHGTTDVLSALADVVNAAIPRGGVLLVAAFAVGRVQQFLYLLHILFERRQIPELPIYIDSPMAVDATEIYASHKGQHDLTELDLEAARRGAFHGRNVHFVRTVNESKALNQFPGPGIIISSSGMMTGGRILHHLRQRLPSPKNTILLGGFQAAGTRGRSLQDGARFLRMHGMDVPVRAAVAEVSGLSGHADRGELLRWLKPLPPPKQVFLTHGEKAAAQAFAAQLKTTYGWSVAVPKLGESVSLEFSS